MPSRRSDRSVSPLIGVVMLLAIVVALAVTVGVLVVGVGDTLGGPPPFVANEESVRVSIGGNETHHTLQFAHRGGDVVDADRLTVVVSAGGTVTRIPAAGANSSALDDGRWSAGEGLDIDLRESVVCAPGVESATVELLYRGPERDYALSSGRVPVERGQFVIDGGAVRATTDYTANVKFVGTGWGTADSSAPVNVTVHVGGELEKAWRMVHDSDSLVGAYGVSRQDSGTELEVRAAGRQVAYDCAPLGIFCSPDGYRWVRVSSTSNTENVRVYRDGDDAPAFESADGQQSAAAYVAPYVEDGEIILDDNQAVYLFDFNDADHDYQDAVVLVSFFTQRGGTGVYESGAREVVLCPAETRSASPNGGNGGNGNGNGP